MYINNSTYLNDLSLYYQMLRTSSSTVTSEGSQSVEDISSALFTEEQNSWEQRLADRLQSKIDDLISAGTLTQEQGDAVLTALKPSANDAIASQGRNILQDKLDGLVSAGTITEEQKVALQDALKPAPHEMMTANGNLFKMQLDSLVTAGTITEEQEDAVLSALQPTSVDFSTGNNKSLQDKLEELVASGIITEEQMDAIDTAIKPPAGGPPPGMRQDEDDLSSLLEELVAAGTLTEDQKDAVLAALETDTEDKSANRFQDFVRSLYEQFTSIDSSGLSSIDGVDRSA